MKSNRIILYVLLALFAAYSPAFAQKSKTLSIYHSSDTHSRIEPIDINSGDKNAGMGGYVRRVTLIDELRKENPNLLLFDCGDFSQGTPYYNMFKGKVEIDLMNLMHYDAVLIGNHEFDYGVENMVTLFKMANFPIVCSNYDFTTTPLKDLVKPYVIFKRDGVKVGVIGISPRLKGLVQAEKYEGVHYMKPYTIADELATFLKEKDRKSVV